MSVVGSRPHASACATCARPISPPSRHTYEFNDMFCALNGATRNPRRRKWRQMAVAIQLLPTCDAVPATMSARAAIPLLAGSASDGIVSRESRKDDRPTNPIPRGAVRQRVRQVSWLTAHGPRRNAFPGFCRVAMDHGQASPITVAGPRGILTRFPILSVSRNATEAPNTRLGNQTAQPPAWKVSVQRKRGQA